MRFPPHHPRRVTPAIVLLAVACATGPGGPAPGPAADLAPRPVWVVGEVVRPGAIAHRRSLTVGDALAATGGLTPDARAERILLRPGGANAPALPVDPTRAVAAGDVIEVPTRLF